MRGYTKVLSSFIFILTCRIKEKISKSKIPNQEITNSEKLKQIIRNEKSEGRVPKWEYLKHIIWK